MEIDKAIKLMNKYGKCIACDNKMLGEGQGKLIVEDDFFIRDCKCGYQIKVDENDNILSENIIK